MTAVPLPKHDVVHVWILDTDCSLTTADMALLSADERERADKFAFPDGQQQFIESRSFLRSVLAQYTDKRPSGLIFEFGEHGKPFLAEQKIELSFNMSHTGSLVAVAVACKQSVGIDVDRLDRSNDWAKIARRSFSDLEQRALFALPESEQKSTFMHLWVAKEAYTKGIGDGYSYGFPSFSIVLTENKVLVEDPRAEGTWILTTIDCGDGLVAVVAVEKGGRIEMKTLNPVV